MKISLLTLILAASSFLSFAQSRAVMSVETGATAQELQTILYFEGISYEKFNIKSAGLKGKDFQILIKEFTNGQLSRKDTAFNSREDAYFRIKTDSLSFAVLTKMSESNEFKIHFQFNGFSSSRKYKVLPDEREQFSLKSFFPPQQTEKSIDLSSNTYILAYMTPYVRPDKSTTYCEVSQSGVDPEQLYEKYQIPHYFLVELKFL
ncbi:hypothetical protein [Chitinophaga sp. 22620]|uniref:hypothetical protein n=1 Tax=Chitinophaga sp. 22620 TaxID=3453952 RepID=UPI003F829787